MVHFHHEEPQGSQHSADISANPLDADWIEGRPYTKYDPILVLEGKRLPTPGSGREREYVASAAGATPMGGVQRFRLGFHGATVSIAGMVGYVQQETCPQWFVEVNRWIDELASAAESDWSIDDQLRTFAFDPHARISRCERSICESPPFHQEYACAFVGRDVFAVIGRVVLWPSGPVSWLALMYNI